MVLLGIDHPSNRPFVFVVVSTSTKYLSTLSATAVVPGVPAVSPVVVVMFWVGGQARLPVASSLVYRKSHRNFFLVKTCPEKPKPKGGTKGRPRHTSHTRPRRKPPLSVVPTATVPPTQGDATPWCVPRCFSSCCAKVISRNISCSTWLDCWALIARVH